MEKLSRESFEERKSVIGVGLERYVCVWVAAK
jgi:hypothetical protein